jgi:hypothetical protein
MKRDPRLDFYENVLPQHVSRAMGDRLSSRKKHGVNPQEQHRVPVDEDDENIESRKEEGLEGSSENGEDVEGQEPVNEDAAQEGPKRRVYMMPSERLEKKKKPAISAQPKAPSLKPRVIR